MGLSLPRILILDTGGTISQTASADGSLVPCSTDYIEMVPRLHDIARLEVLRLERMDSSDMTSILRMEMARLIYENYDGFDGFVVIHGTDTMVETAAALSYMVQNLGKPVVLTGAQLPIFAPGPDGLNNLYYSVKAASMDLGEVVICFGDRILRGNRSIKENVHGFNAFHSFRVPPLGELGVSGPPHPPQYFPAPFLLFLEFRGSLPSHDFWQFHIPFGGSSGLSWSGGSHSGRFRFG
jgi:L-asparaginase